MIDQLDIFSLPIQDCPSRELPTAALPINPKVEEAIAALREIKQIVIAQFQIGTRVVSGDLHGVVDSVIDEILCMVHFDGEDKARQVFTDYLSLEPEQTTKSKAKPKPSLPKGIKVGDMVTYLDDGTIGRVTSLSNRCINIETAVGIQSHNLGLGTPKLEIHTHPNESVVFAIGDRVTLVSKNYDFGRFGMGATVTEKNWDKKIKCTRIKVVFDDGTIYSSIEGAGWFKPLQNPEPVLVEDFAIGQFVDTNHCGKNLEIVKINGVILVCKNKQGQQFGVDRKFCSPTLTSLVESAHFPLQPETLEKSRPSPMLIPAEMRKKSTKRTSLKSQSTQISETIIPQKELTSSLAASHAQEPVLQEVKQDLTTPNLQCGLSTCDASEKDSPSLLLSRTQQDYSIAEWEQSYKGYPKAGTMRSGRLSPLQCLEVPKNGSDFLSLPTMTTGLGSGRNGSGRNAGATRSEKWLKDKLLLQSTQALNPQMMALLFAFPMDWTECLLESPRESEDATMLENFLEEQSTLIVQQSQLSESCTCTKFSVNNIDASSSARLNFLLEQRDRLISSGACPDGVWICCSKVPHRDFEQAVWKSSTPRKEWGDKKSQYIGKRGKEDHLSAIAQHRAGQELRKIEREIKKLQVKS